MIASDPSFRWDDGIFARLLQDIRRALVAREQIGAVLGRHERLQRLHAREQPNEIILAAERKNRVDQVVPDTGFALLDLEAVDKEAKNPYRFLLNRKFQWVCSSGAKLDRRNALAL
jgi:hypothetical protein